MKYFCLYHHKASLEQQKHKWKADSNQEQGWTEGSLQPGQGSERLAQQCWVLDACESGSEPGAAVAISFSYVHWLMAISSSYVEEMVTFKHELDNSSRLYNPRCSEHVRCYIIDTSGCKSSIQPWTNLHD